MRNQADLHTFDTDGVMFFYSCSELEAQSILIICNPISVLILLPFFGWQGIFRNPESAVRSRKRFAWHSVADVYGCDAVFPAWCWRIRRPWPVWVAWSRWSSNRWINRMGPENRRRWGRYHRFNGKSWWWFRYLATWGRYRQRGCVIRTQ